MSRPLWVLGSILYALPAAAGIHYVRADAPSGGNGSDWTHALKSLSGPLERGGTYYVAGGTYGGLSLDTPTSGALVITIKKATLADHGPASDWNAAYAASRADFGGIDATTDYWVVDGQTRNESNWNDGAAYGFHFSNVLSSVLHLGAASSHMTFRYLDVGGTEAAICRYLPSQSCDAGVEASDGFYCGGFGTPATDWTIQRVRVHNIHLPFQLPGCDHLTVEESWIGPNWSKEAIRGGNQNTTTHATFRWNKFVDSCKGDPTDSTAQACTAIIAIWDSDTAGGLDNNAVYGNLFLETNGFPGDPANGVFHSDACVNIGGNNNGWRGVPANHSRIFNNTFVGMRNGRCEVGSAGAGSDNLAQNNIWYSVTATTGCDSGTGCASNGVVASGSQFVNPSVSYPATGFDYHLASALAGSPLPSPYDVDIERKTRGSDGIFDRGAYEFGVGSGTGLAPAAPTGLRVQ
jgi:hypothetical protein